MFAGVGNGPTVFVLAFVLDVASGEAGEFEVGWWLAAGTSVALVTGGLLRHRQRRQPH